MIERVCEFSDKHEMLPYGTCVLVCVSGGKDSMCLLDMCLRLRESRNLTVIAAHYNHMLRGAESDRDEAFVREYCAGVGVALRVGTGDAAAKARECKKGIEETARTMRYDYFTQTARHLKLDRIATAHTADDNAETVLLNLTRGAGLRGLCGIPTVRSCGEFLIVRPILCLTELEILEYLQDRKIPFVTDTTNTDVKYTRNAIRHNVLPHLYAINPKFSNGVLTCAETLRADEEYLTKAALEFIEREYDGHSICTASLRALPLPIFNRVFRHLTDLSKRECDEIYKLVLSGREPKSRRLSDVTIYLEYGRTVIEPTDKVYGFSAVEIKIGSNYNNNLSCGLKMTCQEMVWDGKINKRLITFLFKKSEICGKLTVRPRKRGDMIRLEGRAVSKSVKKLLTELKIPSRRRDMIPVICDELGVLGVYKAGRSDRAKPAAGDIVIKIAFEEETYK